MPSWDRSDRAHLTELPYDMLDDAVRRLTLRTLIDGECWLTRKGLTAGYSQVSVGGWPELGHRVAWLLFRGDIPDACTDLDHFECGKRACWNPWHVEPVTHAENMARHREKKYGSRKLDPIWIRQPGYSSERVREWRRRTGNK